MEISCQYCGSKDVLTVEVEGIIFGINVCFDCLRARSKGWQQMVLDALMMEILRVKPK